MTRPDPTNVARQAAFVERQRIAGRVRVRVWVPAGCENDIRERARRLCQGQEAERSGAVAQEGKSDA